MFGFVVGRRPGPVLTVVGDSTSREPAGSSVRPVLDRIRLPVRLYELLDAGQLVMVCARTSHDSGNAAFDNALTNLTTAVRNLKNSVGVGIEHLMPSREVLGEGLRTQSVKVSAHSKKDGEPFSVFSWVYDAQLEQGFILLLQYGSGTKIALEDLEQPVIQRTAEVIEFYEPVIVYGTAIRSMGRGALTLHPIDKAVTRVELALGEPIYVANGQLAPKPYSAEVRDMLYQQGAAAVREAGEIAERTAGGMMTRTADGEVSGKWAYAMASPVPPPLSTGWVAGLFKRMDRVAFVDTAGQRPPGGVDLPSVVDMVTGQVADQLLLVRWFYSHYLTEGWDDRATAEELVRRGYINDGWRRTYSPATRREISPGPAGARQARGICESIWRHREFHLTHSLTVSAGDGLTRTWTVITADGGPIATAAQVERIARAKSARLGARASSTRALAGLPWNADGVEVTLAPASHRHGSGGLVWNYERPRRASATRPYCPGLPNEALMDLLARALQDAAIELVPVRSDRALVAQAEAHLGAAEVGVQRADERFAKAWNYAKDPDMQGMHLLVRAAAAGLDQADAARGLARREVRDAKLRLEDVKSGPARMPGLVVDSLLELAASLQDPWSPVLRRMVRQAVTDGWSRTVCLGEGLNRRVFLLFGFTLNLFDDQDRLWQRKVESRIAVTGRARRVRQVCRAIAGMHQGIDPNTARPGQLDQTRWFRWIRGGLGIAPTGYYEPVLLLAVKDERLLSLGARLMFPLLDGVDLDVDVADAQTMPTLVGPSLSRAQRRKLATEVGEDPVLLERLFELYSRPSRAMWLRNPSPRMAALVRAASGWTAGESGDAGEHRDGHRLFDGCDTRLRVRACRRCGSRRRAMPRLREAVGLVCLVCRFDDAGLVWAEDPYERWMQ